MGKQVVQLDRVIIRFAGDSGDGMQLTGDRFTSETAMLGNDLATLPDFPAEIRAPAGTLPGVSAFQLHFADHDIMTPGDAPNVLVAMNPAALKANLPDLPRGSDLIVNTDEFTKRNLQRVGYEENPLETGVLEAYRVHAIPLTSMTVEALKDVDVTRKEAERAKNMFALGLLCWLYHRPTEGTIDFLEKKFASKPTLLRANTIAFETGWSFGETTEDFSVSYEIKPAPVRPGRYRNISGNLAMAYGLLAASWRSSLPLFLGSYPITPASDILHELSKHKRFGVRTFQAEDEIAGIGAALGAAFGGHLGVTTTSGPGPGPQGRDGRARRLARAAPGHLQHPARRTVDRSTDQDRAVRPAPGSLRTQWRGTRAGRRPPLPQRLLRRDGRGSPHRRHLSDACHRPVGRLPRQRLRAVAPPRPRRTVHPSTRTSPPPPTTRQTTGLRSSGRIFATPPPSRAPGRPQALQVWSTGSAASRSRTAAATSPTTRRTTT